MNQTNDKQESSVLGSVLCEDNAHYRKCLLKLSLRADLDKITVTTKYNDLYSRVYLDC